VSKVTFAILHTFRLAPLLVLRSKQVFVSWSPNSEFMELAFNWTLALKLNTMHMWAFRLTQIKEGRVWNRYFWCSTRRHTMRLAGSKLACCSLVWCKKGNETGMQLWGWTPLHWAQSKFDAENRSIGFQSKKQDASIMMTQKFSRCFALNFNAKERILKLFLDHKARHKKQSGNNKCELWLVTGYRVVEIRWRSLRCTPTDFLVAFFV